MQITNSRRRSWRPLVWGLVIALGAVSAVAGKVDRRHPGKLSAKARDDAGRKGGARMDVLVRFRKTPGAAENALVKAFGGSVRRPLKSSSRWMSLRLPASVVAKLAENAIVEFVASDPLVGASLLYRFRDEFRLGNLPRFVQAFALPPLAGLARLLGQGA